MTPSSGESRSLRMPSEPVKEENGRSDVSTVFGARQLCGHIRGLGVGRNGKIPRKTGGGVRGAPLHSKSTGSGEATASLDTATHELSYDVTFSGFASEVTAAHIHGPAPEGKNGGVVLPLGNMPKSPIHGSAKLTPDQEKELMAGMYYVNIHSKNNPGGAIRGQLTEVK
jgi:hypothetical protein